MVTILITLQSRKRKDNTQSVVIRVRYQNRYFDIPAGAQLTKKSFERMMKGVPDDPILLKNLEELKGKYIQKLREFQKSNKQFTINELKEYLLQKPPREYLIKDFWSEQIENLIETNRGGSARTYKNTLSVLSKIIDLNKPFKSLTIRELEKIEKALRLRGNNYNSIAVYLRTLRAICNKAINFGLVELEWYPFRKYKIRKEKTVPRVISLEEMQCYFNAGYTPDNPLFKAWNIGKLIFLLRGINLRDLLFLTKDNIKGDRIIYKRGKTRKMYSIKIEPEIEKALKVFSNDRNTLLGIVLDEYLINESKSLNHRAQITKRINAKLTKIGEELKLSEKLTTYVFRYSYANIARKLGYSKDIIAEALGHEYGNSVTGIYLELFDQSVLDEMNNHVIKSIFARI
ncbi:tyrosine-type recombinase/integrase [Algoriphagus formosus]|uniref:tyrosine-type recombinase/integrase n=1 Tax=Algoriphagus formosus TaxID=2007308 RepID=UPI003F70343E